MRKIYLHLPVLPDLPVNVTGLGRFGVEMFIVEKFIYFHVSQFAPGMHFKW